MASRSSGRRGAGTPLPHLQPFYEDIRGQGNRPGADLRTAEARLLYAVLAEAIHTIHNTQDIAPTRIPAKRTGKGTQFTKNERRSRRRRRLAAREEAIAWLHSDEETYVFSFRAICEVLALDYQATRIAIMEQAMAGRRAPMMLKF